MKRRTLASIVLSASTLLGVACSETKTPTEPAAIAATPTPAATQDAVVSGVVLTQSGYPPWNGLSVPGATLSCQGRSTTTALDGTYQFSGLHSGPTDFSIVWEAERSNSSWHADLKAGPNVVNMFVQY